MTRCTVFALALNGSFALLILGLTIHGAIR